MVGLCRSEFRSLTKLALLPVVVTVGYLLALNGVRQSPEQLRAQMAEMAAANGGVLPPDAAAQVVLGRLLPVVIVFGLLILLAGLLFQGAGWFSILRRANHEHASIGDGARFAVSRLAALVGWSLAGGLLVAVAVGLPLLPGILAGSGPVVLTGAVVAMLLALTLGSGVISVLPGVVLLERGGLRRVLALLRGRWLATGVRMLIASLVYIVYGLVTGLLVAGVAALTGPGLISSLVQGLTVIPFMVFQLVVAVVTYAELRGRADGTSTGGLAAELVGRASSATSFDAGPVGGRPRRRWRGLRWVTPVLVLAMLAAGAPSWAGASVAPVAAVAPMDAVSPVLAGPEDGGGGDPGGGAGGNPGGGEPAVSGPSNPGPDSSSNGGGDQAPKVSGPEPSPGDNGGQAGARVDAPNTTPQPQADAGPQPAPPPGADVTAPNTGPGDPATPQTGASVAPPPPGAPATPQADASVAPPPPGAPATPQADANVAPPPPGDPAAPQGDAAVPGPLPGDPAAPQADAAVPAPPPGTPQEGAQVAGNPAPPPGTDPNTPGAIAGAPQPVNPADPNANPTATQSQLTCVSPATCDNPNGEAAETSVIPGMSDKEAGHLALDGAGMMPVIGEAADVANGIWYFAEGDWGNGLLSLGSAIPGIGNAVTAGKWASKAGKLGKLGDDAVEGGAEVGKLAPTTPAGRETLAQGENPALKSCLNSFTATTLVLMADGTRKPIKDVARGNTVLATDPITGERGPREVTDLIRHGGPHTMVAVQLAGAGQIDATDKHPFWVASQRKWVDAIDLKPGDVVLSDRGDQIKVTNLKTTQQDLTAYNLTVAGLHTYYVGDKPVLVHNADCGPDLGESWKPKPASEVCGTGGCEKVADDIKSTIGGDIMRITDKYGAPQLGKFRGTDSGWNYHDVVVKDGRVFDATTGRRGEPIDQYRTNFEYGDDLVFSPAPR